MTTTAGDTQGAGHLRAALAHGAGTLLAVLLLPLCLAAGMPFTAWLIAFILVAANRLAQGLVWLSTRDASLTVQLGSHGFSMIFRALLTALTLFFVGASIGAKGDAALGMDRPDLAKGALIIFIVCFTLDVGIDTIRRMSEREQMLATKETPA